MLLNSVGLNIFTFLEHAASSLKNVSIFFSFVSPFTESVISLKACKPFFYAFNIFCYIKNRNHSFLFNKFKFMEIFERTKPKARRFHSFLELRIYFRKHSAGYCSKMAPIELGFFAKILSKSCAWKIKGKQNMVQQHPLTP